MALAAADIAQGLTDSPYAHLAFLVDEAAPPEQVLGLPVLGSRRLLDSLDPSAVQVFPAGSTPSVRRLMSHYLLERGFGIPSLISPRAVVANTAQIGPGALIESLAFVGHRAQVGAGVLMGASAGIGHDSVVGHYCSLYAGARLLGFAKSGDGLLCGANAVVGAYRHIGEWSKVSMGAMVFEDVPDYVTVAGNPAQITRRYAGPQPAQLYELKDDSISP
ncbi:MAG: hypothetical protein ACO1RX_16445 [Candidatus Sericytochromatia bacterium]